MDILNSSFSEAQTALKTKKISAKEMTQFYLNRIEKINPKLNAFLHIDQSALKQAELIDQKIAAGENAGLLAGLPFGIKDLLCVKNMPTTAASKMLKDFVPPYDATVVKKLKNAGAIIMGKLNLDEFAMGSSNENSHFGSCKNPWNTDYVPGGSSGGSAAAQAARLVMGTIGTDTGGSIRQPSSFCGIVGVKPTYGRVSRFGIVAFASSLDQAGPMVSSVKDAALTLEVICGQDANDGTSSSKPVEAFSQKLNPSVKGLRIAVMKEYHNSDLVDPDIRKTYESAIENLK